MIRFIIAKNKEEIFSNYIQKSLEEFEIHTHIVVDDDTKRSIFEKYNLGIESALSDNFSDDDICVFVHEDVKIIDKQFKEKIQYLFNNKKDVGLCGVIGTEEFNELGGWWMNAPNKLKGHIIQENEGREEHLKKVSNGYFNNIVAVDGCFFAIRGKLLKDGLRFDETLSGFHFYDIDICFKVLEMKYKVCIADILIQHRSPGNGSLSKEWFEGKIKFVNKYKEKQYKFPITVESFKSE